MQPEPWGSAPRQEGVQGKGTGLWEEDSRHEAIDRAPQHVGQRDRSKRRAAAQHVRAYVPSTRSRRSRAQWRRRRGKKCGHTRRSWQKLIEPWCSPQRCQQWRCVQQHEHVIWQRNRADLKAVSRWNASTNNWAGRSAKAEGERIWAIER